MRNRIMCGFILLISVFMLSACGNNDSASDVTDKDASAVNATTVEPDADKDDGNETEKVDKADKADNLSCADRIITSDVPDGFKDDGSRITISKAGEYSFSGEFTNNQIYVDAKGEKVVLVLDNCHLANSSDSVIYVEKADEVTIKLPENSVSVLDDNRPKKVDEFDETGSACIFAKSDLKLSGKGTLKVSASYNNGIHSKKDIKIKSLSLEVTAPNNAVKGNDSITIESGNILLTSTEGDGLKTKNNDLSSKGRQRGIISIESGNITIYAADDCIKASFDVQITEGPDTIINQNVYEK